MPAAPGTIATTGAAAGTGTFYCACDPTFTPEIYPAGTGFVEETKMGRYLSIVTAGLLIGTATAALGQQSKASDKDRQLFEQLRKDYEAAYNRQDATGVAALYADDAVE